MVSKSRDVSGLMKAVNIVKFGGAENLKIFKTKIPDLEINQVLVKVIYAGVNRPDILQREGKYPVPKSASQIPGLEVSGIIVDKGKSASKFKIGEKICGLCHGGGYAEYVAINEDHCMPIPKNFSLEEAACLPETFITVWSNVFLRGKLKKNESILIHGGSSGIGTTAVQLANYFGATVYATAGTQKKCIAVKKLGAIDCFNYKETKFEDEVNKHTSKKGVDLILDMVAGEYVNRNMRCLNTDGRLIIIAVQGGIKGELNYAKLMVNRQTVTGSTLRPQSDKAKSAHIRSLVKNVWPILSKGKIKPIIQKIFSLSKVSYAHKALEKGDHVGKFILKI